MLILISDASDIIRVLSSASTMTQVVGILGLSSCNYRWNSIKLRKIIRVVTSYPAPGPPYVLCLFEAAR